jgi:DNA-binding transcriptional regulator YiaG
MSDKKEISMQEESRSNISNLKNEGRGASMARIEDGVAAISDEGSEPEIDDRGTSQSEAVQVVKRIRDEVFGASDEKLALALGRSSEEIAEWLSGERTIDGDALMKVRALERERK